ncbi:hypothetical protein HDU92_001858 [Lobulomyces angularis]|nr:hypothetical protein HDU92_001858 [Lobulomyces angularis]
MEPKCTSPINYKTYFYTVFGTILSAIYFFVLPAAFSFLLDTGSPMNFDLAGTVSREIDNFLPLLMTIIGLYLKFLVIFSIIFYAFYYIKNRIDDDQDSLNYYTRDCSNCIFKNNYVVLRILLLFYITVVFARRPRNPYSLLTQSIGFEVILQPFYSIFPKENEFEVDLPSKEELRRSENKTENTITDFSFLKRKKSSKIKNVVMIFCESCRVDTFPFNYNSELANLLTPEAKANKSVTPFFDNFVKKGTFFSNTRTVSGYTIKSLLSTHCSIYPYPRNFAVKEQELDFYKKCFPELLTENGFATKFFQTSSISFDNQKAVTLKQGFQDIFSKETIEEESDAAGIERPPPLNYFGYEDQVMIPKVMEWVDIQLNKKKPFQLSLLTNANHHPWSVPDYYKKQKYVEDDTINNYLNTLTYIDNFLKDLINCFEVRGLLENTIFTFVGDHGVQLGEHNGRTTTSNIPYEVAYKVPLLFYTENPYWKRKLNSNLATGGDWTNLDILPTIFDILNPNYKKEVIFDYNYEGFSMLHGKVKKPTFSMSNPGLGTISMRTVDGFKYIYDPKTKELFAYDLNSDPNEINTIPINKEKENQIIALIRKKFRSVTKRYMLAN